MRHPGIVALYAVAMGILEAIVVVYLRRLYYPDGFGFPLVPFDPDLLRIEVIREAMTLVMLGTVAWISAARPWSRLMAFLFAFGVWDVAYYAGLKIFLDWPARLLEPDILFLIPAVWVGPVLAPVLVAVAWIAGGLLLHNARPGDVRLGWSGWGAGVLAAGVIVASFVIHVGTPEDPGFAWGIFLAGYLLGLAILAMAAARGRRAARREDGGDR